VPEATAWNTALPQLQMANCLPSALQTMEPSGEQAWPGWGAAPDGAATPGAWDGAAAGAWEAGALGAWGVDASAAGD
jgi:hypothetical protein